MHPNRLHTILLQGGLQGWDSSETSTACAATDVNILGKKKARDVSRAFK